MKYGKIENGNLIYAPNTIEKEGKTIYNPSTETLMALGYKKIVRTEYPKDDKQYKQEYVETADNITVVWNIEDYTTMPLEKRKEMYDDLVDKLIRRKYSVSAELAILRQRDVKYAEFLEYNEYAENCKIEAKAILGIV